MKVGRVNKIPFVKYNKLRQRRDEYMLWLMENDHNEFNRLNELEEWKHAGEEQDKHYLQPGCTQRIRHGLSDDALGIEVDVGMILQVS